MYPCPRPPRAARARGHIPGCGEITAAWLLLSSCHRLFPLCPPPSVPTDGSELGGRSSEGEADVLAASGQGWAGLRPGARLHCDAGHFFRRLLVLLLAGKSLVLKQSPTEVFLTRTACSRVVPPGWISPGRASRGLCDSGSCCPGKRRESCGRAARGCGKLRRALLGYGGRRRGPVPFSCPGGEPLAWLAAKNLLTRQGQTPGGGRDPDPLSEGAFVLPDRLPTLPPGHQTCFPPRKTALLLPPRCVSGATATLRRLPASRVLPRCPRAGPQQPALAPSPPAAAGPGERPGGSQKCEGRCK